MRLCWSHIPHYWKSQVVVLLFFTFPYGALGQMRYLIVSIPDLCLLHCFNISSESSAVANDSHGNIKDYWFLHWNSLIEC